ncbi:hypothetical protein F0L74_17490 [Chitinophaga agrisoli]|uniref:Uncharacterized protein n=1 Tax=Chitinophaga agrisoli TaxID=2607653 RepID=A0A5B2VR39_9BACT|nr:hypothetical protein [Chitinophaga agrisoli]KAA2241671.1 hypothetical protein F0L74_17490 [Chitinophaga agrisoli]
MITTLDAEDIVWNWLDNSPLKNAVTGGIYKNSRPLNSDKEDVVINSQPISAQQLQEGLVDVNIYVPADHARMQILAAIATSLLTEVWIDDVCFSVQQQAVLEIPETHEPYISIRLLFYAVNL